MNWPVLNLPEKTKTKAALYAAFVFETQLTKQEKNEIIEPRSDTEIWY